jgi:hypothetical protein
MHTRAGTFRFVQLFARFSASTCLTTFRKQQPIRSDGGAIQGISPNRLPVARHTPCFRSAGMSQIKHLLLFLCILFGVFLVVAIPNFMKARTTSDSSASCRSNIRELDAAKQQWAVDNKKTTNDVVTWNDIRPYLSRLPVCQDGGLYTLGRIGEDVRCTHTTTARRN